MPNTADQATPTRPRLFSIADVFALYADFTLGGGSATDAVMRRGLLDKRGWVSPDICSL